MRQIAESIDAARIWHKVTFRRGRILTTEGAAWEAFDSRDHYADPRLFYRTHGRIPEITIERERPSKLADVERFTFPSMHRIEGYPYAETNVATGRLYRLRGNPRAPVAVLSHGWAHDAVRTVEVIYVEPLLKAGFSVALPAHPFHFERTPSGTTSGELMVSGDVVLTVEAFRQAVADLCGLVGWLRQAGHGVVGVIGYSLGGYLAALTACLRDDLEFVVIGAAGDSVVSPILDTGLGVNVREDLAASGMHERERLERAWGIISPGRFRPRVPKERVLIVAGVYDRIMLPRSVARLWESWGRPQIRWENQGHYSLLAVPGRLVRRSLPFLSRCARLATVPAAEPA
ncbi:MAG TPA: alpha/beta hydrolase family protein [Candidatus Polarisedimenticolia bacterium]|nr:alpha/beta hydrolase family protein [Candidatus Polarisedimenticolia bacterium]